MTYQKTALSLLFVGALLLFGCFNQTGQPSKSSTHDSPSAKPTLIGQWTTSTSKELAATATRTTFLESGEYQIACPLKVNGTTVTAVIDGKEQIAPFNGSGTWELKRGQLRVHVMTANIDGWKGEPANYKVLELTEKKHVLEKDGEKVTFFRSEIE